MTAPDASVWHAGPADRVEQLARTARRLAVELDRREAQRRETDAAVTDLLVAIALEHPGFDWTTERTVDAVDILTKLVLPAPGAGTCAELIDAMPTAGLTIGDGRPYPPTGLTTAAWAELEPVLVDMDAVTTTQDVGDLHALVTGAVRDGSDAYPHVVAWRSRLWLEDGHNRVVRRYLRGIHVQRCRVFRIPTTPGETPA